MNPLTKPCKLTRDLMWLHLQFVLQHCWEAPAQLLCGWHRDKEAPHHSLCGPGIGSIVSICREKEPAKFYWPNWYFETEDTVELDYKEKSVSKEGLEEWTRPLLVIKVRSPFFWNEWAKPKWWENLEKTRKPDRSTKGRFWVLGPVVWTLTPVHQEIFSH